MIRLGRIYRGLMVEVQASNAKLARRREKMVARPHRPERWPGARGARAVERQRQARRAAAAGLRSSPMPKPRSSALAASCASRSIISPSRRSSQVAKKRRADGSLLREPVRVRARNSPRSGRNTFLRDLHRGRFKSREPHSHPVNMVLQFRLRSFTASSLMRKLAARGASRQGARTRGGPGGSGRRGRECRALTTEAAARLCPPNWQRLPGQTHRQ